MRSLLVAKNASGISGSLQPAAAVALLAVAAAIALVGGGATSLSGKLRQQAIVDAAALGGAGVQAAVLDLNAGVNLTVTLMHIGELTIGTGGLVSAVGMCLTVVGCPEGLMIAAKTHDIVSEMLELGKQLADVRDQANRVLAPALVMAPYAAASADAGSAILPMPVGIGPERNPEKSSTSCAAGALRDNEATPPVPDASRMAGAINIQVDLDRETNADVVRAMMMFPDLLLGGSELSAPIDDDVVRDLTKLERDLQTQLDRVGPFADRQPLATAGPSGMRERGDALAGEWRDELRVWLQRYDDMRQRLDAKNLAAGEALAAQVATAIRDDHVAVAKTVKSGEVLTAMEQRQIASASIGGATTAALSAALHAMRQAAAGSKQADDGAFKKMLKWLLAQLLCGGAEALEKIAGPDGMAKPTVLPGNFHARQYLAATEFDGDVGVAKLAEARPDSAYTEFGEPILWPGFAAEPIPVSVHRRAGLGGPLAGVLDDVLHH